MQFTMTLDEFLEVRASLGDVRPQLADATSGFLD